jgi:hypothetical protein
MNFDLCSVTNGEDTPPTDRGSPVKELQNASLSQERTVSNEVIMRRKSMFASSLSKSMPVMRSAQFDSEEGIMAMRIARYCKKSVDDGCALPPPTRFIKNPGDAESVSPSSKGSNAMKLRMLGMGSEADIYRPKVSNPT